MNAGVVLAALQAATGPILLYGRNLTSSLANDQNLKLKL